ncbi:hypothetical protein MBHK15_130998 [Marinobacter salarius]|nr:hypothetical protein MBHK15_130998 [Marinobacter salarius]
MRITLEELRQSINPAIELVGTEPAAIGPMRIRVQGKHS